MNDILLMLTVGFVAGGAVSSIIWAIIGAGRKKAAETEAQARKDIMDTIVSLLADADGIESKYRNGELTVENFRRNIGDKCNAALKVLRENMHCLDGFFVRYADQEIREYLRTADKPDRRKEKPIVDSQHGRHAEPGAMAAPTGIGAVIQNFGEDKSPAGSQALKVVDTPPENFADTAGKPDQFEPSKPLMDAAIPKIAIKPHTDPVPAPEVKPIPEPVIDITPEPAKPSLDAAAAEFEQELVIDVKPEPAPVVIEPKPAPVIDVKPEPKPEPAPIVIEPKPDAAVKEESAFDLPVTAGSDADVWSEQSIEEFEAAFAKFEEETEAPKADAPTAAIPVAALAPAKAETEEHTETGVFPIQDTLDEFETPTMEIPVSALQALKAEQPVSSTPSETPAPSAQTQSAQIQAEPSAPAPKKEEKKQDNSLGITGDDVSDALDNMFKF